MKVRLLRRSSCSSLARTPPTPARSVRDQNLFLPGSSKSAPLFRSSPVPKSAACRYHVGHPRLGRRAAQTRLAHFLCEVTYRLQLSGSGARDEFEFPLTQRELADLLGLSPVHVNRTYRFCGGRAWSSSVIID